MATKDTTKYGKYIVTELKQNILEADWTPKGIKGASKRKGGRVLFLDSEVVPGAFYVETVWLYPHPGAPSGPPTEPHKHDWDEILGFFGTNMDDPYDLGGEIELWLEDEKHILTKTCIVFVPKGMMHCPLVVRKIDRPIFEFTTGPGTMYG
jgi:hypothetical protein